MPDFQKAHEQYQDRVLIFGLDVGPFTGLDSREDGQALLAELGVSYPAGTTSDRSVVQSYGVLGMPTTVFITPSGQIVKRYTGILLELQMGELIEELIQASSGS